MRGVEKDDGPAGLLVFFRYGRGRAIKLDLFSIVLVLMKLRLNLGPGDGKSPPGRFCEELTGLAPDIASSRTPGNWWHGGARSQIVLKRASELPEAEAMPIAVSEPGRPKRNVRAGIAPGFRVPQSANRGAGRPQCRGAPGKVHRRGAGFLHPGC